ncbi:hypothetical protein NA78x_003250 [Anatilimnocola sp. NA78]|uniref:hypothetical protein n=1 Tax=Anatilimnocola sp. NA78 TaxID=3415683 RepID=UPI003CE44E71
MRIVRRSNISLGLLTVAALSILSLAGCGGSSAVKVAGNVTFQDKPIENGEIIFVPADSKVPAVAGKIEQGKYVCEVPPGASQVKVTAYREVPGKFDTSNPGQKNPLIEMYIPEKYNSKSELSAEVDPSKPTLDFKL